MLQDAEDVDEQVEEVQVEVDGGQYVLLRGQLVHYHVHVKHDEATEQQSSSNGDDKVKCLVPNEYL